MAAIPENGSALTAAAAVSGVLTAAALGFAAVRTGGGVGIAALVGVVSGVGAFLFVPYVVRLDRFGRPDADGDGDGDGPHVNPGAVGAALAATGFVVLALSLVLEDPLLAAGIGLPLAGLQLVIWSLALPRAVRSPDKKPPVHRRN
jgi:hypothetical protein